jgi:hypothetical protein
MLLGQKISSDNSFIKELLPTWSDEQRNKLQEELRHGRKEHATDTVDFDGEASTGMKGRGRNDHTLLMGKIQDKLKETLAQLKSQTEAHELLLELCTSETTFRPQRLTQKQKDDGATSDLTLFQQVAQGIVEVSKDGEMYQMREVLQWEASKCENDPKAFIEAQLRGDSKFEGFKKSKPFQFVGGKQTQFDKKGYHAANMATGTRQFASQCLEALKQSYEVTLAREWEEELGSALTEKCLKRISDFSEESNHWTLHRKLRYVCSRVMMHAYVLCAYVAPSTQGVHF